MQERINKLDRKKLLQALGACNALLKNPSLSLTPDDVALNLFSKSLLVQRVKSVYLI